MAAVHAVTEILQTGPIARLHVKRMLNDRYGLIDYQTMFGSLAESDEPREGMLAFDRVMAFENRLLAALA